MTLPMSGDFKVGVFIALGLLALMIMFLANRPESELAPASAAGQHDTQQLTIAKRPAPEPASPASPAGTLEDSAAAPAVETPLAPAQDAASAWPADASQPATQASDAEVVVEQKTDEDRTVGAEMTGKPEAEESPKPAEDAGERDLQASAPADADTPAAVEPAKTADAQTTRFPVKHIVAKGETLSDISMRYYGTHKGYYHIYQANKDQLANVNSVRVGQELLIPAPSKRIAAIMKRRNAAAAPALPQETSPAAPTFSPRRYTVRKGDSLCKIARKYYNGDERMWTKILQANRDKVKDPARLPVGVTLVIPPI